MTTLTMREPVSPTPNDVKLAMASSRQLSRFTKKNLRVRIANTKEEIELPAAAVRLLVDLLSAMAEGNAVTLIPIHAELTTQEAADQLGVSRPFLVKQLEDGVLAFRKVGTHRRVLYSDLLTYKRSMMAGRLKALDKLAAQGQELNMGY